MITVEVAATPNEKERGLMYRTELAADRGMLFVFDVEAIYPFWMKNTWIDLDILYLDTDGRITKIYRRVPRSTSETPDDRVARVHGMGRYVLELPAGAVVRHRLKKGQRLKFDIGTGRQQKAPESSGKR